MPEVEPNFKTKQPKGSRQKRARARRVREYNAWAADELEVRTSCEAVSAGRSRTPGCRRWSSLIHHRRRRSHGGALMMRANTMALCSTCHGWIHGHVTSSRALGWLVGRGDPEYRELGEERSKLVSLVLLLVTVAGGALGLVVFVLAVAFFAVIGGHG